MGSSAPGGPSTDDPPVIADGRPANSVDAEEVTVNGDGEAGTTDGSPRPGGPARPARPADPVVLGEAAPPTEDIDVPAERGKRHRGFHPITRYRAALRRHPTRTWVFTGVAAVVLILFLMAVDVTYQSYRIYRDIKSSIGVLQDAKQGVSKGTLPSAAQFYDAAATARDARSRIEHADPVFRLAANLPGLRGPLSALTAASAAAEAESHVATDLGDIASRLIGSGGGKGSSFRVYRDGAVDVALLTDLPARLQKLVVDLRATQSAIRDIPNVAMFGKVEKIKTKALKDSTQAITLLHRAILGSQLLPEFLGADGPKTYFIAIQNNADQRGTGGAVLGYAIVRFDHGQFQVLQGGGINDIDNKRIGFHVPYPPGVQWYLDESRNAARINNGANYTANFPLVGESWTRMAEAATGLHIDGAIAIDPFAIAAALKGQGALDVPAYPGAIDSHNLVQVTEHDQYTLEKEQQKRLPHELIRSAFKVLEHPKNFVHMANGLAGAVTARHVQVWLADPKQQALVDKLGWEGALQPGSGDVVGVVYDKRIRGKQDFWTQETLNYDVKLSASGDASSVAKVTMADEIPKGQPPRIVSHVVPYGLNVAMVNLYVPIRAQDENIKPSGEFPTDVVADPTFFNYLHPRGTLVHTEGRFKVLTKTVTPYPGHPQTIFYTYSVPNAVRTTKAGKVYQLVIPHQPLYKDPIVDLTIQLPRGAHAISATKGMTVSGSVVTFHTHLSQDLKLQVVY